MARNTHTDDTTASPLADFAKLLATNYADDAPPNRTGCLCPCPECRADNCLYCWDDGLSRA